MVKKGEDVVLQPLQKKVFKVKLKGTTSLLMEKMSMDVVKNIDKKGTKGYNPKEIRKLEEEKVEEKIWKDNKGNVCYPSSAFMKGMVENAPYIEGLDKKKVRGSVRIMNSLVPINFKKMAINESWGRTSGISKSPRLILRPEFVDWDCELEILYNSTNISPEQIVNLLNWSGFHNGVGGWRPEHSGTYGQYEVNKK